MCRIMKHLSVNIKRMLLVINVRRSTLRIANMNLISYYHLVILIMMLLVVFITSVVASDMCLPKTGAKKGSSKVVPGWNEHVQTQHDTSLFWHDIWVQCCRPHNGEVADIVVRCNKGRNKDKNNRMAEAINEGNDRNLWKEVHSLTKSCYFLPNVIDGHIGSEDIAVVFSLKFEQVYTYVGFVEDRKHLLKCTVDNLVINMCVHETDDNNDGHNCHQQHGIDIVDLKKCVNCMKHVKKEENGIFSNHIIHVIEKLFKALALLYNGMLIHGVSPSYLLIGTQKDKRTAHHSSDNYRALTLGSIICKLYYAIIIKQQTEFLTRQIYNVGLKMA